MKGRGMGDRRDDWNYWLEEVVLDRMELMHLLYHDHYIAGVYTVQIWGSGGDGIASDGKFFQ